MNNRLKDVVRALPRIKGQHIKRDYEPAPATVKKLTKVERRAFEKNSPIFLWDGSPVMVQDKPSIGAEHRFKHG